MQPLRSTFVPFTAGSNLEQVDAGETSVTPSQLPQAAAAAVIVKLRMLL
jgi:hypothetical protein